MSGGGEGGKNDRSLMVAIAALLFGMVQFALGLKDDSQLQAVQLEARLTRVECLLGMGGCKGIK